MSDLQPPSQPLAPEAEHLTAWDEPAFSVKVIMLGFLLVLLFIGSLMAWSVFAPLQNAVVAPGIVSVASHRKQVQHFEGGIVEEILVADGDQIKAGQVLVKLRDIHPQAQLHRLERNYAEIEAVIARLLTERKGQEQIEFPSTLIDKQSDPAIAAVIAGQTSIFQTRLTLFKDKQSVMAHKIAQHQEQITGLQGQLKAKQLERSLIQQELTTTKAAVTKKLLPIAEQLKLEQRQARADGDLSQLRGEVESLQQSILEVRLQISESQAQRISDINEELRTQEAALYELEQQIISATDILHRTQIVSPIDGIVVNLQVHTADGVIAPGQTLMEIVPSGDELVVYAYIRPEDIEEIQIGMHANIKLASFNRHRLPLNGKVASISADRVADEQTRRRYYRARIQLNPDSDAMVQASLIAGMSAEVFIITGSRAPMDYLLSPIFKSMQLGLREK